MHVWIMLVPKQPPLKLKSAFLKKIDMFSLFSFSKSESIGNIFLDCYLTWNWSFESGCLCLGHSHLKWFCSISVNGLDYGLCCFVSIHLYSSRRPVTLFVYCKAAAGSIKVPLPPTPSIQRSRPQLKRGLFSYFLGIV